MERSILTITVIEAKNIRLMDYDSQSDLYVLVECANQTAQTKHLDGMLNPIWDETFQFEIHNGREEIKISVMDKKLMKQDTIVGVLFLPLNSLKDQVKIEDWFNLESPFVGDGKSNGRIRLQLWWIHSKTKLIEDRIYQTEEDIQKIIEDK